MKYKHNIEVTVGGKNCSNRIWFFRTNDDNFNYKKTFTNRSSITNWSFPKDIDFLIEDLKEDSAGTDWDFENGIRKIESKDIIKITIDGVNINKEYEDIASAYGFTLKFPLIYQMQIFKEESDTVFNWYMTTGTLTSQSTSPNYYNSKRHPSFEDFESVLEYINKNKYD